MENLRCIFETKFFKLRIFCVKFSKHCKSWQSMILSHIRAHLLRKINLQVCRLFWIKKHQNMNWVSFLDHKVYSNCFFLCWVGSAWTKLAVERGFDEIWAPTLEEEQRTRTTVIISVDPPINSFQSPCDTLVQYKKAGNYVLYSYVFFCKIKRFFILQIQFFFVLIVNFHPNLFLAEYTCQKKKNTIEIKKFEKRKFRINIQKFSIVFFLSSVEGAH